MTSEQEQPKLTGSGENLYAGKRGKSMSQEGGFEQPLPQEPNGESAQPQHSPDADPGSRSPDQHKFRRPGTHPDKKKKGVSILDSISDVESIRDVLETAEQSDKPPEIVAALMLRRIEYKSQQQEMRYWDKAVLFDEYKDWAEFSGHINDEENEEAHEMAPEIKDAINRVGTHVRSVIIDTVNREHGETEVARFVSPQPREEWHKTNNTEEHIIDADQIKNDEIRKKFTRLIQQVNGNAFDDMRVIHDEISAWKSIDPVTLKNDPVAREAVEKAQDVLDKHAREHSFRRREQKSSSTIQKMGTFRKAEVDAEAEQKEEQARQKTTAQQAEETVMWRNIDVSERLRGLSPEEQRVELKKIEDAEKAGKQLEEWRKLETPDAIKVLESKVQQYSSYASTAESGAEKTGHDKGSDFMRKEQAWVDHKLQWNSLHEQEKKLARKHTDDQGTTIVEFTDEKEAWSEYGWTDELRKTFIYDVAQVNPDTGKDLEAGKTELQGSSDQRLNNARLIATEYVLQGYTAEKAIEHFNKNELQGVVQELGQDRDEIMRLHYSNITIEQIKDNKMREDPNSVYELAWQIARSDAINFGEEGKYPVWERRISREATGANVFAKDAHGKELSILDAHGKPRKVVEDKQRRAIEIDAEGNAVRVVESDKKIKEKQYLHKAFVNEKNQLVDLRGNVIMVDENGKVTKNGKGKEVQLNWDPKANDKDRVSLRKHEFINKEHFLYWQRDRSIWLDDYFEQDKIDFVSQVTVLKNTPNQLSIQRMLDMKERVFNGTNEQPNEITGEYEKYEDLWHQSLEEAYALSMIRNFHWDYVKAPMHDDAQLSNKIFQLFYDNHFTKPTIGKTLWYFTEMMPEKFRTLATSDGKLGAVINTQFLSFYHLSNYEKLTDILSTNDEETGKPSFEDAALFNLFDLRRIQEGIYTGKETKYGTSIDPNEVWNLRDNGENNKVKIKDVFNLETGELKKTKNEITGEWEVSLATKAKFVNLINYFTSPTPNTLQKNTVQEAIRMSATRMHNLNSVEYDKSGMAMKYTETDEAIAKVKREKRRDLDRAYLAGTISKAEYEKKKRDGTGGEYVERVKAGDFKTKMEDKDDKNSMYSKMAAKFMVRWTGAAAQNDIGSLGDPNAPDYKPGYPVGYDALTRMLHFGLYREKMLSRDPQSGRVRGGQAGNPYTIAQFKNLLVNPLLGITTEIAYPLKDKNGNVYDKVRKPIIYVFEGLNEQRKKVDIAERERRVHQENKHMSAAEWAENEEYRETAAQLTFNENAERHWLANQLERATKIYKEVLTAKPLGLQGEHAPEVGYTIDRDKLQEEINSKISAWRYLTETYDLINYDMMMYGFDLTTKQWKDMSVAQSLFGADMLTREEFMTDGKIDPIKIQKDKHFLYKQALLTYIAGEFNAYRQMRSWSTDPRHDFAWYENIIDILEKIPAAYSGTEEDMKDVDMGSFFTHHEMGWFQERTGTSFAHLYGMALLKAIVLGDPSKHDGLVPAGFGVMLATMLRQIVK